jgi:hypothetical protein
MHVLIMVAKVAVVAVVHGLALKARRRDDDVLDQNHVVREGLGSVASKASDPLTWPGTWHRNGVERP